MPHFGRLERLSDNRAKSCKFLVAKSMPCHSSGPGCRSVLCQGHPCVHRHGQVCQGGLLMCSFIHSSIIEVFGCAFQATGESSAIQKDCFCRQSHAHHQAIRQRSCTLSWLIICGRRSAGTCWWSPCCTACRPTSRLLTCKSCPISMPQSS